MVTKSSHEFHRQEELPVQIRHAPFVYTADSISRTALERIAACKEGDRFSLTIDQTPKTFWVRFKRIENGCLSFLWKWMYGIGLRINFGNEPVLRGVDFSIHIGDTYTTILASERHLDAENMV